MFDRTHPGAHRALDAFGAMRMGGDEGAALGGFLDGGADLGFGVLRLARLGAGSEHRAGGDDLDEIRAVVQQVVHVLADFGFVVGNAEAEPGRDHGPGGQAGDLAATAMMVM